VVKALRYKSEGPGIDSRCRQGFFFVESDSSICPGHDSVSKNEYQVHPGVKGGRCARLTTYHHMPMSINVGALTFWNPVGMFGPVMQQNFFLRLTYCQYCHVDSVLLACDVFTLNLIIFILCLN
jgi:hypothetical protein